MPDFSRPALIVTAGAGLGNRIRPILGGQRLAALSGRKFYLNWRTMQTVAPIEDRPDAPRHTKRVRGIPMPGDWSDYFETDFARATDEQLEDAHTIVHERTLPRDLKGDVNFVSSHWVLTFEDEPAVDSLHPDRLTPEQAEIMREIQPYGPRIRPAERLADTIDAFSAEFDIDQATLGVHIRLNHPSTQETGPDRYFYYIDAALSSCRNIFLCTDNDRAEHELRKRYGRLLTFNSKRSRLREEPDAMDDAVIDLMLLSRVGTLVRNHASTFGSAAWWLGGCMAHPYLVHNRIDSPQRLMNRYSRRVWPESGDGDAAAGRGDKSTVRSQLRGSPRAVDVPVVRSVMLRIGCCCDLRTDCCSPVHPDMPETPVELARAVLDQTDPATQIVLTGSSAALWLRDSPDILKRTIEENRTLEVVSFGSGLRGFRRLRDALETSRITVSLVTAGNRELHNSIWGDDSWAEYAACLKEYGKAMTSVPAGAGRVCAYFHLTEATAPHLDVFLKLCLSSRMTEVELVRPGSSHHGIGSRGAGPCGDLIEDAIANAVDFALYEGMMLHYPTPEQYGPNTALSATQGNPMCHSGYCTDLGGAVSLSQDFTDLEVQCDGTVLWLHGGGHISTLGHIAAGLSTLYRLRCVDVGPAAP